MIGSHHIIVETKKIKYEFEIKRNITVIRGDSATGKTTLIDLLSQFARFQGRTGVKVESDVPCVVYSDGLIAWQEAIKSVSDSIIFIDEDYIKRSGIEDGEAYVRKFISDLNLELAVYKRIGTVLFRDTPFERTSSKKIKRIYN